MSAENCTANNASSERRPSARSRAGTLAYRWLARLPWPRVPGEWAPVFLVGCGRSGTTIAGKILASHHEILVLNEPRHIWRAVHPATDIWYRGRNLDRAKLVMAASDIDDAGARRARRMFYGSLRLSGRRLLVEKLPVNSFRFAFLKRIFPRCRFLHIVRNGFDVASSIAQTGPRWYGANGQRKWLELVNLGVRSGFTESFLSRCDAAMDRGLVEWTLSVSAARAIKHQVAADEYHEFRYEDLIAHPQETVDSVLRFLGAADDPSTIRFALETLYRRQSANQRRDMPREIGPPTRELLRHLESA